jgi:hypothetical protein
MSAHGILTNHPRPFLFVGLLALCMACAPTMDVVGVYFPDWLVSIVAGVALAYGIVLVLSWRPATRELADSGLFFLGLAVGIALSVWWVFFSRF